MKTAKWIIILVVAAVGAYVVLTQSQLKKQEALSDAQKTEGVQIRKRYDDSGNLKSDAEYLNGMIHGVARNYYPDGSVHSEIHYVNNIKDGISTWFYEDGKPYRITPFKNGKKSGVQKKFYKTGKLMAEVPYENGDLLAGTKEYASNGKLIKEPEFLIKKVDTFNPYITLEVKLSENQNDLSISAKMLSNDLLSEKKIEENHYNFLIKPLNTKNKSVDLIINATYKTKLRNPKILVLRYNASYQ
ncbi:MAG: toxin-antitoxin system YwqK family antitoxin [Salinivirgaceae bacterium]|nr:toxin-antitoxin system YwqK family antitoxin [Salinivirgaceae bacterium]